MIGTFLALVWRSVRTGAGAGGWGGETIIMLSMLGRGFIFAIIPLCLTGLATMSDLLTFVGLLKGGLFCLSCFSAYIP